MKFKIALIKFVIFFTLPSFAQTEKLKLYFLKDADIKGQELFVQQHNVAEFSIIYQQFFVTNNKLDERKMKEQILKKFPSENSSGFCVLDWEGDPIRNFKEQSNKQNVDTYKRDFIKAIRLARSLRPNVKWAFYHILSLTYSGRIENFRLKNNYLEDVIKEQDFIAPSLYVYNPSEKYQKGNENYMRNKLLQALEYGKKYNIPVYPFVWHRTPSKTKNAGNELIPIVYFQKAIQLINSTKYGDVKAKGIFWWHSESYSYRSRKQFPVANQEYRNINDVNSYQKKLFDSYYNSIRRYIN